MREASPVMLIGNNLALLVAACELTRRGKPVTLMTDARPPGGHFAGIRLGDRDFDAGMVMLEKPPAVLEASAEMSHDAGRPAVRDDWTQFGGAVGDWLDAQAPLRRVPTPSVQVEGRIGPDYLIANRLDLLGGCRAVAPAPLDRSDPRHAVHKATGALYDSMSYAQAARLHHGDDWHGRFVEPFVHKLFDVPSQAFLARFHRAGWVPLYYPDTLAGALKSKLQVLPEYAFHTTDCGFVGAVVARLLASLAAAPSVRLVTRPLQSLVLVNGAWQVLTDDGPVASRRLALGLPVERCNTLLGLPTFGPPAAASVVLMFCLVQSCAIGRSLGCHMVVDDTHATYRLTDQDAMAGLNPPWHRVVVEASPRRLSQLAARSPCAAQQRVLQDELGNLLTLRDDCAVQVLKLLTARNALVLPTLEAVTQGRAAQAALADAAPGASLTGALLGYGKASFNEQIVQGLQLAEDYR